jgi:hypothetical protein
VLTLLSQTPQGRNLLESAKRFWGVSDLEGVAAHLRMGDVSRTDAVLTRHYDSVTGEEHRNRIVNIYLKQNQPVEELVLDLAHEMIHATTRPDWDPYDPELTAVSYIHSTIEGPGGEVKAVMSECEVEYELSLQRRVTVRRCKSYYPKNPNLAPTFSEAQIATDFYRSGTWTQKLINELGDGAVALPLLSARAPVLFSSTGNAPYPWALFQEYRELSRLACENTLKRVERDPASVDGTFSRIKERSDTKTRDFLTKRCNSEVSSSLAIRH